MDPLSDILSLLHPRSYVSAGLAAGGDWCVSFGPFDGLKCNAIVSGACWLVTDGGGEPVRLEAGDCFILTKGRPFRMGSDLALPALEAEAVFARPRRNGVVAVNDGDDFFLAGSRFTLAGSHAGILLDMLPPVVHIRKERDQAMLRWALERMREELGAGQPGGNLVAEHLAHLMLVQALRLFLTGQRGEETGWLYALADRRMAAAIGHLHDDPARRWTVQELARLVGMSRTAFAVTFRRMVGLAPMDYLTRWRMLLAADRLLHSRHAVASIAVGLGYESESAFGAAFKRVMGCSPRQYGRREQAGPPGA